MSKIPLLLVFALLIIIAASQIYSDLDSRNQLELKEFEIQQLKDEITKLEDLLYCEKDLMVIYSKDINASEDAFDVWIYIENLKFKNNNFKIFQDGQELDFKGGGLNSRYIEVPVVYADQDTVLEIRYLCECSQYKEAQK